MISMQPQSRRPDGVGGLAQSPYSKTRFGEGMADARAPPDDMSFNMESVSSYQDYPTARPLLGDQVARRKDPDKVRAVPESNSRGKSLLSCCLFLFVLPPHLLLLFYLLLFLPILFLFLSFFLSYPSSHCFSLYSFFFILSYFFSSSSSS